MRYRWPLIKGDKKWRRVVRGICIEPTIVELQCVNIIPYDFLHKIFKFKVFCFEHFTPNFLTKKWRKAETSSTLRKLQTGWVHPPCPKNLLAFIYWPFTHSLIHILTLSLSLSFFSLSLFLSITCSLLTLSLSFSLSHSHLLSHRLTFLCLLWNMCSVVTFLSLVCRGA
jgi:hypothetical protein